MPAAPLTRLALVQAPPPPLGESPWAVLEAQCADLALTEADILLLPEHATAPSPSDAYRERITSLAKRVGCYVVGGSHHEPRDDHAVNTGVVADPRGMIVARYDKCRPYARERSVVTAGAPTPPLQIGGRTVRIVICADFWFTDLLIADAQTTPPDLVLVPAFSVTRKPTPDYARALWRHLAVARAYEFGVFVGVSDWAHVQGSVARTSGVSGFADPTQVDPQRLFTRAGNGVSLHTLDFEALDRFRHDRRARGFFWTDGKA